MIVRNEAHQLRGCLEPVANLFDEIVIVDTGSRDETREIALQFTPQVHEFAWCDDFAAARNESLRHASGDWIFWLDADDRLDAENINRLKRLLTTLDSAPAAYLMDTACQPKDEFDSERLITHPRLFFRHEELGFLGRVHEQLDPAPASLGYAIHYSDVRIRHIGYRDAAQVQRKLQRDIRLLRMDYAVDPADPRTLLHLGTTYGQLGKIAEARKYLLDLLAVTKEPHDYLRRVFSALADLSISEGRPQEAVEILKQGRTVFPYDDYLAYLQSEAYYELDDYEAAKSVLVHIMYGPDMPQYKAGSPDDIKRRTAPRSLGEVLRIQRQLAAAEAVLKSVVEMYPQDALGWHGLGRVYIDMRSREQLQRVCEQLASCPRGQLFSSLLWAAWHMMHGEWKAAERTLDQLIATAPQMPILRLMRAEVLTRRGAALASCLQAYRDVLRVQPGNAMAAAMVQKLEGTLHRPTTVGSLNLCATAMAEAGTAS
jgi:glycosyltransferase involved in cell wall biosynthesis